MLSVALALVLLAADVKVDPAPEPAPSATRFAAEFGGALLAGVVAGGGMYLVSQVTGLNSCNGFAPCLPTGVFVTVGSVLLAVPAGTALGGSLVRARGTFIHALLGSLAGFLLGTTLLVGIVASGVQLGEFVGPFVAVGIPFLFVVTGAVGAYELKHRSATEEAASDARVSLGLAPLPGGMGVAMSMRF